MDRKRLSPWLKKQVNAGKFGLRWVNKEEQCFSIPWRHKSNRAWNKEHFQLFKEWAKFTNRYQDGEKEDWPGWKQRLRSALNKLCDFEEMHDMHNLDDPDNPYKVYKFVAMEKMKKDMDSASSSSSVGGSPYPQPSPSDVQSLQASPHFDALSPLYQVLNSSSPNNIARNFANIPTIVEDTDENVLPCEPNVCLNIPVSSMANVGGLALDPTPSFHQQPIFVESGEASMEVPNLPSDLLSLDSNNLISGTKMPSDEFRQYKSDATDLSLQNATQEPKIRYKICFLDEVLQEGTLVDNEGAHFYFGQLPQTDYLPDTVFGPKGLRKISFPDITNIKRSINSDMTQHMQDILMKMNRGFLLQYSKGDIYIQRLCRTRIFAYNPLVGSLLLGRTRKTPDKLFDFSAFKEILESPENVEMIPPPETVLTFGQEMKNWDTFKNLYVRVELSHLEAWELREKILPPSLKSTSSIQYSDFDSEDRLLESLRCMNLNNVTPV